MVSRTLLWSLATVVVLTGCATPRKSQNNPSASDEKRIRNHGYSLLYDLLSEQKSLDKVLIVKMERPDIRDVIEDIARNSGDLAERLQGFASIDTSLDIQNRELPLVEAKTRQSIKSDRTKELLFSTGRKFELRLLLTQTEALSYGSHLAKTLREHEKDQRRRMFLEEAAQKMDSLYSRVFELLMTRIAGT